MKNLLLVIGALFSLAGLNQTANAQQPFYGPAYDAAFRRPYSPNPYGANFGGMGYRGAGYSAPTYAPTFAPTIVQPSPNYGGSGWGGYPNSYPASYGYGGYPNQGGYGSPRGHQHQHQHHHHQHHHQQQPSNNQSHPWHPGHYLFGI